MIAVDTSSLISYLSGEKGADVEMLESALVQKQVVFPPVVLTEVLSDPALSQDKKELINQVPLLSLEDGFWERAGRLRAQVISKGLKARLADSLIAQFCLDHSAPLITRDSDFQNFARLTKLKLLSV